MTRLHGYTVTRLNVSFQDLVVCFFICTSADWSETDGWPFLRCKIFTLKERYTLRCTTQKDESTTQKANEELIYTTQKVERTTQNANEELIPTTQKPQLTTPKAIFHKIF